jgi:hypothetical protein
VTTSEASVMNGAHHQQNAASDGERSAGKCDNGPWLHA